MAPAPQPRRRLSVKKKLLFAAATTLVFFGLCEALLTLGGVRPAPARDPFVGFDGYLPLFVEETGPDGRAWMTTAANKLPWFNEQRFPREKSDRTFRIVCLGGSTTYGRPYDDSTSFCGWLRELLPEADPSREWEVINAGGISYASYRVAALMQELADYQPDLFIVYSGHNEFLEERTYRDLRRLPAPVLTAAAFLTRTRTGSVVSSLIAGRTDSNDGQKDGEDRFTLPAEVDALLDRSVGPADYRRDDRLRSQVVEHFELNLARMTDLARAAGAEIVFVVPASNLRDCEPFKSQHRDDLPEAAARQWEWLFERATAHEEQQRWDEALALYQQAAAIDGRFALLHERLGRTLAALDRWDEARAAFERARDEDVCPLRAPTEIVAAVRRYAARSGVPAIDFPALLEDVSQREHGPPIPGRELFLDHVHPTITGHRLLATALVEELIGRGIVSPSPAWPDSALAAADRRIEARVDPEMQGVALRNLAKVLAWAGKHHEAGRSAFAALERIPDDPESTYLAACYLKMEGRTAEALDHFRRALPHRPDDPEAHLLLADTLAESGDWSEALVHYTRALQLRGEDAHVRQRMGTVLVQLNRLPQAVTHYRAALRGRPDDPDLHYNLAVALSQQDDADQARAHYREALRLRPQFPEAHNNLALLLAAAGRKQEALHHYREALRIDPNFAEAKQNLDRVLER